MENAYYTFVNLEEEGPFQTFPQAMVNFMSRVKQLPHSEQLTEILATRSCIQIRLFENIRVVLSHATIKALTYELGLTTEDGTPITPMPNVRPEDIEVAYIRVERRKPNKARAIVNMWSQHAGMIQN